MAVDPSYTVRLAWHAHDLDTGGHLPADQVPYDNTASGLTATNAKAAIDEVAAATGGAGAPASADYLVGTASGALSAEIVVGTTPGGELGGTWASPTVDATHSGSTHAATQAAAEATAATALSSPRRGHHERPQRDRRRHHGRRFLLHEHDRRRRATRDRGGRHRRWLGDNREGRGHDPDDGRDVVRLCRRGSDGHEHGRRGDGDGHCGGLTDCRADRCSRFCRSDPDDRRHHEPARTVVDRGRDGLSLPGRCVR
jgi:hypothetical protein